MTYWISAGKLFVYSVVIHETDDISHTKQVALVVRYGDPTAGPYTAQEDLLGFVSTPDTTRVALTEFDFADNLK